MQKEDDKRNIARGFVEGVLAGWWAAPRSGFSWRSDLQPVEESEGLVESGPWLVANGHLWRRYPVLRPARLFPDFVQLACVGTEQDVSSFAEKYGPLGVPLALADADGRVVLGESLWHWQQEARKFACLWQLWRWVEDRAAEILDSFLRWQRGPKLVRVLIASVSGVPEPEVSRRLATLPPPELAEFVGAMGQEMNFSLINLAHAGHDPAGLLSPRNFGKDSILAMRLYIHGVVNDALMGHVNRVILPSDDIRFFPDTLITAIYLRFQNEMSRTKGREKECPGPNCPMGGLFIPKRRDQKYCSKTCKDDARYVRGKGASYGQAS